METKDKTSRSSSKANLNESTLPLLEDVGGAKGDTLEKEKIELETKGGDVAKDDGDATTAEPGSESGRETEEDKKGKKKKDKKEKKEKVKKCHKRSTSCVETLTVGLNLLDRDEKHVNDHINLVFEDVIAEPDASHGFDGVWKLAYLVFSSTRLWAYRLLAAFLALPCGLTWGLLFSLLQLLNIWLVTPLLRVFEVVLHVLHRVWSGLVRTFLDPVFMSIGKVAGDVRVTRTQVYPKNDFAHDP
ncbi:caveolin-3-like [Ornithodoros turicata]|uniref:caveolin-3-like n=1 Tax=Ornithodoros turicata TaxID=34597 RepID=UPI00313913BA